MEDCPELDGLNELQGESNSISNHYSNLNKLWKKSTFYNLMDNHPLGDGYVFQIDGNLGATAAIAEMLAQNDEECVRLLPALPEQWPEGHVKGLMVAGGATLDMSWKEGRIMECIVLYVRLKL